MATPSCLWSVGCQIAAVSTGASTKLERVHLKSYAVELSAQGASRSPLCPGSHVHLIRPWAQHIRGTCFHAFKTSNQIGYTRYTCVGRQKVRWPRTPPPLNPSLDKTALVWAHFFLRRNVQVLLAKWSESLSQMLFLDLRKPHMICYYRGSEEGFLSSL